MTSAIIIPARYASTRLPGKPLLNESGKPLIQYAYENAKASKRADVVAVATDDRRIADAVERFGGRVVMTGQHSSGTARVAEAASALDTDIIVNLQGDEPEINPNDIDHLISVQEQTGLFASTLACPFPSNADYGPGSPDDPAAVKVVLGAAIGEHIHRARYFSRRLCPYPRTETGRIEAPSHYYLHIGVYAFSKNSLNCFAAAAPGALEEAERLEQLRILEMGEHMAVGLIDAAPPGIDTREDYDAFLSRLINRSEDKRQHDADNA